jgi:hypothetical protein
VSPEFRKVALIAASLGLIVSLFFALRPDDDETAAPATIGEETTATTATTETVPPPPTEPPATTTTTPVPPPPADATVTIRIAIPSDAVPEVRRYSVRSGRKVELVVRAELADHVHLHGYDLIADVGPGRTGVIEFTADAPGRFEIELEERGLQIAELEVRP